MSDLKGVVLEGSRPILRYMHIHTTKASLAKAPFNKIGLTFEQTCLALLPNSPSLSLGDACTVSKGPGGETLLGIGGERKHFIPGFADG